MKKLYRDLSSEAKASYGITDDGNDESWVYCSACERAMPQGDCVVGEDGRLHCAYEDCRPEPGCQNLHDWDTYAMEQGGKAAHWPEKPEWGERYHRQDSGS